jgi:hypothetical protein
MATRKEPELKSGIVTVTAQQVMNTFADEHFGDGVKAWDWFIDPVQHVVVFRLFYEEGEEGTLDKLRRGP